MKFKKSLIYMFITIFCIIGCDEVREMGKKTMEMSKEAFKKNDLLKERIKKEIGSEPEISWRVHNNKTMVNIHFDKLLNEEIMVREVKIKF